MTEPVKARRSYDATGRRSQAAANRSAVIEAAGRLFLDQGYGRTTITAIASAAGVSPETVYATFGTKADLLHRVWDVTVGGDDEEILFHERPEVRAIRAEPDLRRRLVLHAEFSARTAERIAPFLLMVQSAAGTEPAAGAMAEEMGRQRLEGISVMAAEAARTGQLTVSEEECRDVMWATTDGLLWHRLVRERGWSQERYTAWLGHLWVSLLTEAPPDSRRGPGHPVVEPSDV